MNDAKVAHRIREKVTEFSGKVSAGLPKTAGRLVREVVYGMQSRGSVRLSEIARSLEEPTRMKKVIERLGRQLNRAELREKVRAYAVLQTSQDPDPCFCHLEVRQGRNCCEIRVARGERGDHRTGI